MNLRRADPPVHRDRLEPVHLALNAQTIAPYQRVKDRPKDEGRQRDHPRDPTELRALNSPKPRQQLPLACVAGSHKMSVFRPR